MDCEKALFNFSEWTCTDESCSIISGRCIKKGQFHVDLILAAFMQILLWNYAGCSELILDDLDLRRKKKAQIEIRECILSASVSLS